MGIFQTFSRWAKTTPLPPAVAFAAETPPSLFNASAAIEFASSPAEMIDQARLSPKNDYMFNSSQPNPLEFVCLEEDRKSDCVYFYTREPDGEITGILMLKNPSTAEDPIDFKYIAVKSKRNGVGTALLRHALGYAAQQEKDLYISSFMREGYEFCKRVLPAMHHAEFPEIDIYIDDKSRRFSGKTPYAMPPVYCMDELPA